MSSTRDRAYMQMAYSLAEKSKGWASPNPYVGAVIVQNGTIIGHGYHEKPGKPHAEALALDRAGNRSAGATAYITLEPCVHWGRTPPCIDRILKAGLNRIVISALDPNPLVYKKGIEQIRKAGIALNLGILKGKNTRLNESYIKYITQKKPFITLKAAISLDGKITTANGDSQWISLSSTREYIHLLRGEHDAIMVGINTILEDDPMLTVRHPHWAGKKILRVILDSQLRIPLDATICSTLAQGEILIFTHKKKSDRKQKELSDMGIEVVPLDSSDEKIDLDQALSSLGQKEIASILVEGGARLHTSILQQKLADKVLLTISPKLIGGADAPSFFQGKGFSRIKDALQLKDIHSFEIDDDIIVEGYF